MLTQKPIGFILLSILIGYLFSVCTSYVLSLYHYSWNRPTESHIVKIIDIENFGCLYESGEILDCVISESTRQFLGSSIFDFESTPLYKIDPPIVINGESIDYIKDPLINAPEPALIEASDFIRAPEFVLGQFYDITLCEKKVFSVEPMDIKVEPKLKEKYSYLQPCNVKKSGELLTPIHKSALIAFTNIISVPLCLFWPFCTFYIYWLLLIPFVAIYFINYTIRKKHSKLLALCLLIIWLFICAGALGHYTFT